jgi:hypothetical protein
MFGSWDFRIQSDGADPDEVFALRGLRHDNGNAALRRILVPAARWCFTLVHFTPRDRGGSSLNERLENRESRSVFLSATTS